MIDELEVVNNTGQTISRCDEPEDTLPGSGYGYMGPLAKAKKKDEGTYVFRKSTAMN